MRKFFFGGLMLFWFMNYFSMDNPDLLKFLNKLPPHTDFRLVDSTNYLGAHVVAVFYNADKEIK